MAKKSSVSSARGKQTVKNAVSTRTNKIDYSDIPEISEKELKKMKRIGMSLNEYFGSAVKKRSG